MAAAFDRHQQRTLSHGRLLGPAAAAAAVEALARAGLEVVQRPSPWRLGPGQAALATAWFTGWLGAAVEQEPQLLGPARRTPPGAAAQLAAGSLAVTVDHVDLLALPRT